MISHRTLDLAALTELAREVAVEAAALLRGGLGQHRHIENKTTATDLVTEMDRAAESLITARLLGARPHDGFIGEEGTASTGSSGLRWVVDPLDGTTNYVYGLPAFAVSIAAEVSAPSRPDEPGQIVAGVVVDVTSAEVFTAHLGGGATHNGEPLHCTRHDDLATALVATGFSYESARRARQAEVLTTLLPRVRDIRRMGAASLDLCAVASGRVDAYYEKGLKRWDFAAGALIAAEAGAIVGDLEGGVPSGDFVLATAPGIAEPLRDLLRQVGAGEA